MSVLDILIKYYPAFLHGLQVSLELSAIIWGLGLFLGAGIGMAGTKFKIWIGIPSRILSFLLSGIPILVFLFWLHYPAQAMFDLVIDPFYTATLTLTIVNIFGVADIIRSALTDFPQQYITAAQVTGLNRKQTILKIQLPLILRTTLPSLLMLQVVMLHTTLFASLISVEEIFRVAQRINAQIYRPVEIYTALGIFFLAVSLPINGVALWLRARFTRDISEA
jgi:His/Glu/Gln/Arg/opine family amino acid ABC transporter permease subunit